MYYNIRVVPIVGHSYINLLKEKNDMNTPNIMRIRPFLDNFSNVAIGHERLFEEMINQFSNGSL